MEIKKEKISEAKYARKSIENESKVWNKGKTIKIIKIEIIKTENANKRERKKSKIQE